MSNESKAPELARWLEHRSMSGVKPKDIESAAELRRQHAEIESLRAQLDQEHQARLNCMSDRQTLATELEAVRKDAERLDAIEKNCRTDPKMDGNHVYWPTTWKHSLKGPNLRAAIDAAKEKP